MKRCKFLICGVGLLVICLGMYGGNAAVSAADALRIKVIVRDYYTNEPLTNACVSIDGVPRYTSKEGYIATTGVEQCALLEVSKDGYLPFFESSPLIGEKTVYLLKPAGLVQYNRVLLTQCGYTTDILNKPVIINKSDSAQATVQLETEIIPDKLYMKKNDEIVVSVEKAGSFTYDFSSCEKADRFTLYYEFMGEYSEVYPLNIVLVGDSL